MQADNQPFQSANIKRPRRILGGAFILLPISAVILLGLSIWYTYSSYRFYNSGVEVEASVVRLEEVASADSGTSYSPVFRYTVNEHEYEYESVNSSNPPSHEVGEVVTLLYDPNHPDQARENSFWELWLVPCIMCPASVLMIILSIGIPLLVRRFA